MLFTSLLPNPQPASPAGRVERNGRRAPRRKAATRSRPWLESLEDRTLLSGVSFEPAVQYGVGPFPESVAVGDFNGDHKPDLAVSDNGSSAASVLLGNGDGTFQANQSYGTGNNPDSVAVADFNGDGKPDLVVTNGLNNVSVLLGNGDGTFQDAQNFATGMSPVSVATGDVNGDGKPDVVTANEKDNDVSVLLGNGDGTFQSAQNFATGAAPFSVAMADFNKDGKLDLVTANANSNNVSVLLGNGDGTFQVPQNFATGSFALAVVVGDFNGDTKPDLAVANQFGDDVSVLLGNGDGSFQAAQNFAVGGNPNSLALGDFNGDGKPDLVTTNGESDSMSVLLGNGDGSFQSAENIDVGAASAAVAAGDFNGDGRDDLAVATFFETVDVLRSQFATTTAVTGPAISTYAQSVTYSATVTIGATPVSAGTVTFEDANTSTFISPPLALNANGQATISISTLNAGSHTILALYSGTPGGAGTTGSSASTGNASLIVKPAPLLATAVNFNAVAGAPFTGTIATFTNPDPNGGATSYTATIVWGDGTTSTGTITGTGTLTVSGPHTYADPGGYTASVQISHNRGNTTTAMVSATAVVVTLGEGIQTGLTGNTDFWHGKKGQALINGFNGGSSATALSNWLATSFGNLYGAAAGVNDLTGETNSQVAAFYKAQYALSGSNVQRQVLATALNVYATTLSLGGTIGQSYGFTVSADGLGADSFNVGADGAAFGVAKKTTLNVYELLAAVNRQAVLGVLYDGDTNLQKMAKHLLHALNVAGSIA
jgi:hypothetical protein